MGLATWLARTAGTAARAYREAKASGVSVGSVALGSGQNGPFGHQPAQTEMSDAGRYATSDDVYAVVNLIADAAATVPMVVHIDGEEDPEHDLSLLLKRGNPWHGGYRMWGRAYRFLLTTGECYLWIERNNKLTGAPNRLWPMPGFDITPVTGTGDRIVDHYDLRRNGTVTSIPAEDIVPLTLFNPFDPLRGLSPLSALRMGLDAEYQAKATNRDLFTNGLFFDAVLSLPGVTELQRQQIVDAMRERHGAAGRRHGLAVVAADASLSPLTLTPRDAEFIELDKLTTRDVAKAYRVPVMFMGDMDDATFSNYAQAHTDLWQQAILPILRLTASVLSSHLAPQFGDDLEVEPDTSEVDALREDEKAKAETFKLLTDGKADPLWALQRLYGDDVTEEAVAAPPPAPVQPVASPGQQPPPPPAAQQPTATEPSSSRAAKAARRTELGDRMRAAQAALLPSATDAIDAAFAGQWRAVSAVLDGLLGKAVKEPGDELLPFVEQAMDADGHMLTGLSAVLRDGHRGGYAASTVLFGLTIRENRVDAATQAYVERYGADHVQWVNRHTKDLIRDGIHTAMANGEGQPGVRRRIQDAFRASSEPGQELAYADRVENIVQTEMADAFNEGNMQAMSDADVEWHEWSYSGLPNSRHGSVDGQVRRVGQNFDVNGYPAKRPGASSLPAGQRCRCKCTTVIADPPEPQIEVTQ